MLENFALQVADHRQSPTYPSLSQAVGQVRFVRDSQVAASGNLRARLNGLHSVAFAQYALMSAGHALFRTHHRSPTCPPLWRRFTASERGHSERSSKQQMVKPHDLSSQGFCSASTRHDLLGDTVRLSTREVGQKEAAEDRRKLPRCSRIATSRLRWVPLDPAKYVWDGICMPSQIELAQSAVQFEAKGTV